MIENNDILVEGKREVIGEAMSIFSSLGLEADIAALTKGIDKDKIRNSYNTLFLKEKIAVNSFGVFKDIRKAPQSSAYFHIPFCRRQCSYCSYEKMLNPTLQKRRLYLDFLRREIEAKKKVLKHNLNPDIFYVGGGTPSLLSVAEIEYFLRLIEEFFDIKNNIEFTFEVSPWSIARPEGIEKLSLLKEYGVNRITVGIESFSEVVTKKTGRIQLLEDVYKCVVRLKKAAFNTINFDLIYGLPGQDQGLWLEDLSEAVRLSPDSITTFALRIRDNAPIYRQYMRSPSLLPAENDKVAMRIMTVDFLARNNYFEDNSDYFFRKKGKKYLYHPTQPHNISRNLIGFGPSAYSIAGNTQLFNIRNTDAYLAKIKSNADPIDSVSVLDRQEYMKKRFAEGLRTQFDDNVFINDFSESVLGFIPQKISRLSELGLIHIDGHIIKLTVKGKYITDIIANYISYSNTA